MNSIDKARDIQITFDKLAFDLNVAGVEQPLLDRLANLAAQVRGELQTRTEQKETGQ